MQLRAYTIVVSLVIHAIPAQAEVSDETLQNHIMFVAGGTNLDAAAQNRVLRLGQVLNTSRLMNACLRLVGYSDASGGHDINLRISQQRAEVIADALSSILSRPERIESVEGVGAAEFLTEVRPTDPHQRRVAIFARDCEGPAKS